MIKYVLIDLDGTLLDFKKGERNAFIDTINKISNYKLTEEDINLFSKINDDSFKLYQNNIVTRPQFHHIRFEKILNELNINYDIDEADKIYVNLLKYNCETFEDVLDFLNYLSNKYDLYVASNGMTDVQIKRMELAKIDIYFKKYYISESCGANKPDIKFFEYIFDDLKDYDKSKYIIIGDRLDSDILGGNNVGIKTIYINRNNISDNIKPDYEIKDLRDIKNIL